jgi:hypothetical protein
LFHNTFTNKKIYKKKRLKMTEKPEKQARYKTDHHKRELISLIEKLNKKAELQQITKKK